MSRPPPGSAAAGEAAEALALFLEGNYDACLQTLQRLDLDDSLGDSDLKVSLQLAFQDSRTLSPHLTGVRSNE